MYVCTNSYIYMYLNLSSTTIYDVEATQRICGLIN